jgi:hypothetical protein
MAFTAIPMDFVSAIVELFYLSLHGFVSEGKCKDIQLS